MSAKTDKTQPEHLSPEDLTLDPANANRGTDRGRSTVTQSLEECGAGRSILADKHGTVIAGNKTLEAARKLGLPIRVVESAGNELVVVRRTDLALDEGDRARRLAYLDNRSSELGLEWNLEQLLADLAGGVDLGGCGFTEEELAALFAQAAPQPGLTDPDEVPELPEEPVSKPGDLWLLGEHRVLCGDATVAADVERVLTGVAPPLMVTDPPYGVEYDPAWRNRAGVANTTRTGTVQNDDRADWREAWALFPGDVAYVWHAGRFASVVQESLEAVGFETRSQIIWAKDRFALSRGHYHWQHEPCWYAVRKGGTGHWTGDRSQTTLWNIPARDSTETTNHGTQKPVECMRRPIVNNSSPGQAIYDPFLGSGTTLIAAEMTGRVCCGLEIDPRYTDLCVTRWQNFTGTRAERAEV